MMDGTLYDMIFKRKSFHVFKDIQSISDAELQDIAEKYSTLQPLNENIRTAIRIVPASETTCRRGEEYCILLYSEEKDNCLPNIGYLGEQLDLYLASGNIGALWFGIGNPKEFSYDDSSESLCDGSCESSCGRISFNGSSFNDSSYNRTSLDSLSFVIMIAIAKMEGSRFRKDMFKSKRKTVEEIWSGERLPGVTDYVRFAPSACNTQPWIVDRHPDGLSVFRYKKPGKRGIMPADKVSFYNRIDIGIFLCFLELCLQHERIPFTREIFSEKKETAAESGQAAEKGDLITVGRQPATGRDSAIESGQTPEKWRTAKYIFV